MDTKTFIFQNEITLESVSELIDALEDLKNGVDTDIPEKVILYFSTPGGSLSHNNIFVEYIPQPVNVSYLSQH